MQGFWGQVADQQPRDQLSEPDRKDEVTGCGEVGNGPPAVVEQISAFAVVLAGQVDVTGGDAGEELPINGCEHGAVVRPLTGVECDGSADLGRIEHVPSFLAQLSHDCCRRSFARLDGAAWRQPALLRPWVRKVVPKQEHPIVRADEDDPSGVALNWQGHDP